MLKKDSDNISYLFRIAGIKLSPIEDIKESIYFILSVFNGLRISEAEKYENDAFMFIGSANISEQISSEENINRFYEIFIPFLEKYEKRIKNASIKIERREEIVILHLFFDYKGENYNLEIDKNNV